MTTLGAHNVWLEGLTTLSAELRSLTVLSLAVWELHSERTRAESVPTVYD